MMKKMEKEMNVLKQYRVYGQDSGMNNYDEYVWATDTQHAVDRVREWHRNDGEDYEVLEVSKIVKNWR